MIGFYGYEVWRNKPSHFEWKCFFFQLFSTIKVNRMAEIMQSAYLGVIIHVKQLLFLVKSKMATIVDAVTRLQQRHHWQNIPHLVKKIKGFPVKAKSFRNTATYQKLWGEVPSLLYHGGLWFCVYVWGLSGSFKIWQGTAVVAGFVCDYTFPLKLLL